MSRLRDRVCEAIAAHRLWEPGQRVAVAVSGGLDSVCLLHLLARTAGRHGGVVEVVTVDHGTRAGSATDADFVEELARGLGLPCARHDLSLGRGASEAACRQARFRVLDTCEADAVALAHHRDDQAETVLVNLLRGTGPGGLEGMAWRRGRYVRPLLDVSRARLARFAADHGLLWRDDPTNRSDRFLRNRVRHEVLPLLESLREGACAAVARSASLAAEQGEVLDALLDADPDSAPGPDGWPRAWVADRPRALVRRALHRHVPGLLNRQVDAVIEAAKRGSGEVALSETRRVTVSAAWVRVQ